MQLLESLTGVIPSVGSAPGMAGLVMDSALPVPNLAPRTHMTRPLAQGPPVVTERDHRELFRIPAECLLVIWDKIVLAFLVIMSLAVGMTGDCRSRFFRLSCNKSDDRDDEVVQASVQFGGSKVAAW